MEEIFFSLWITKKKNAHSNANLMKLIEDSSQREAYWMNSNDRKKGLRYWNSFVGVL